MENGNEEIIRKDAIGNYHFNGGFRNAGNLTEALTQLSNNANYKELINQDKQLILDICEELFNHKAFTGRSGTFYGYEGPGSIYWHMVSKLLLAVAEICFKAKEEDESEEIQGRLREHFYEIMEGIGVHKSPELYGAFPTDPYSHTPFRKGVQQPGMTGQVKEDILSRIAELGVFIKRGEIQFDPYLLRESEFLNKGLKFNYINICQEQKSIDIRENCLAFTYCQIPVIYKINNNRAITLNYSNSTVETINGNSINSSLSREIFHRTGLIDSITVQVTKEQLK